jgi:hypothetical protein
VLKDFLVENRSEIVSVIQLNYAFEKQMALVRETAKKEGRENTLFEFVRDGICPLDVAAQKLDIRVSMLEQYMERARYKIPETI